MRAAMRLAAALCAGAAMLFLAAPAWADRPDDAGPPEDRAQDRRDDEQENRGEENRGDEQEAFVPAPQPPPPPEMTEPREPRREREPQREQRRRERPARAAPQPESQPRQQRRQEPEKNPAATTTPPAAAPEATARPRQRPERADCPDAAEVRPGEQLRSMEALCSNAPEAGDGPGATRASSGGSPPTGPIAGFAAFALLAGLGMRALAARAR